MTAINHAITGSIIGFVVINPFFAIPLALVSHFVLDTLPHFGNKKNPNWIKSKWFKRVLVIDITLTTIYGLSILLLHPSNYLIAFICAVVATLPDLIYLRNFIRANRNKHIKMNDFIKYSTLIQWSEKPIGIVVEIIYFVFSLLVATIFLHLV